MSVAFLTNLLSRSYLIYNKILIVDSQIHSIKNVCQVDVVSLHEERKSFEFDFYLG
jgi:hypothetical protein